MANRLIGRLPKVGIRPVIDGREMEIFRPSAWNSFGSDPEGADYRACKNYGPLYR